MFMQEVTGDTTRSKTSPQNWWSRDHLTIRCYMFTII